HAPSADAIRRLPDRIRDRVKTNLESAVRLFRARTLPLVGSERRLIVDCFGIAQLGSELAAVIRQGVDDQAAEEELAPSPTEAPNLPRRWISLVRSINEDQGPEIRTAGDLLGKYWYRYQDPALNILEAVQLARDLKAAQERGETGQELL